MDKLSERRRWRLDDPIDVAGHVEVQRRGDIVDRQRVDHAQFHLVAVPIGLAPHEPDAVAQPAESYRERTVADQVLLVGPVGRAVLLDARSINGEQRVEPHEAQEERRGAFECYPQSAFVNHLDAHLAEVQQHLPTPLFPHRVAPQRRRSRPPGRTATPCRRQARRTPARLGRLPPPVRVRRATNSPRSEFTASGGRLSSTSTGSPGSTPLPPRLYFRAFSMYQAW